MAGPPLSQSSRLTLESPGGHKDAAIAADSPDDGASAHGGNDARSPSNALSQFSIWIAAAIQNVRWLMKATTICIILVLCTPAHAAETSPNHRLALLSRVACPAVREAVKLYGEAAAEQWARSHGVSDAKIEEAKRCLK